MLHLFTALALILSGAPASAQVMHGFADWTATCTGSSLCTIRTEMVARTDALPYQISLILKRGPAPGAPWQVSLMLNNITPVRGTPFVFQVDSGQSFRFEPGTGYTISRDRSTIAIVDASMRAALVAAMAAGAGLHVTFLNTLQRESGGRLSLKGATAAMAFIDQLQNRSSGPGKKALAPHERSAGIPLQGTRQQR